MSNLADTAGGLLTVGVAAVAVDQLTQPMRHKNCGCDKCSRGLHGNLKPASKSKRRKRSSKSKSAVTQESINRRR